MGCATLVTIMSMVFTAAGAFSLSTNKLVVENTYWATSIVYNSSNDRVLETDFLGPNTVVCGCELNVSLCVCIVCACVPM